MSKKNLRKENDIERLSNQQIVLLTFLVATVSAITASISILRILEKNPQVATQIVHQTIEKTVKQTVENTPEIKVDRTIVIKESDLVVKAIEKNSQYVLSLSRDGKLISRAFRYEDMIFAGSLDDIGDIDDIVLEYADKKESIDYKNNIAGIYIFKINTKSSAPKIINTSEKMSLGSTVVNIYSKNKVDKSFINRKVNDQNYKQSTNSGEISLVLNLSSEPIGFSFGENIFSFDYFN